MSKQPSILSILWILAVLTRFLAISSRFDTNFDLNFFSFGFCQFLRGFPSFFANQIANCLVRVVFGIVVWGFAVLILRIFLFYHVKNIFANWQVTVFGSQVKGTTTMGTYWNRVDKDQLISEHTFSYNLNNCSVYQSIQLHPKAKYALIYVLTKMCVIGLKSHVY